MSTKLHFQLPVGVHVTDAGRVPVELTDARLVPRDIKPRLSDVPTVEEGIYAASATLPDGRKFAGGVKVGPGDEQAIVELREIASPLASAGPSFTPPSDSLESVNVEYDEAATFDTLGGAASLPDSAEGVGNTLSTRSRRRLARAAPADPRAAATPESFKCKLRVLTGNIWSADPASSVPAGWANIEIHQPARPDTGYISLQVQGTDRQQMLEFIRPDHRIVRMALPLEPGDRCWVQLRDTSKDGVFPHVRFENGDIDLLLQYAGAGLFTEALQVKDGLIRLAGAYIEEKATEPIGAALGFYLLLRTGEHVNLGWTGNLVRLAWWLPDALVIHAEAAARQDKHEEAIERLLELRQRGLPLFSSGLSYAVERLARYEKFVANGHMRPFDGLSDVLKDLRRHSLCADPTRPVLTFKTGEAISHAQFDAMEGKSIALQSASAPVRETSMFYK